MSITDLDKWMDYAVTGAPTYTGKSISPQTALACQAVWACCLVLSQDFANLPVGVFRRMMPTANGAKTTREIASDHYLHPLLTHQSNPEMSAWRWKQLMMIWVLLWGNAYAEIEINGRGQVVALWPWRPDRVTVGRAKAGGPLFYTYTLASGENHAVSHDRMLHFRGMGTDGVLGLSPIDLHKQTVGMSLAIQEHGARFFGNGARPLGVLMHPGALKNPDALRKSWQDIHGGLQNSHRIAILEEGLKYQEVGLSMVNAQYIEAAGLTDEQVARIYRVPQHKIGLLRNSTNNNIEHQGLEYVNDGIGPWCGNFSNEVSFSCLSARESDSVFTEFDFWPLLRGDMQAQALYFASMIQNEVLTPDEARERMGYNPHPSGWGAVPMRPLNMVKADAPPEVAKPDSTKTAPALDHLQKKSHVNGVTH